MRKNFLKNKSGEKNGLIGIIAVVVVIYLVMGMNNPAQSQTPAPSGGGAVPPAPSNTVTLVGAPCTQATTLTSSVIRRYTDVAQSTENATIVSNGVVLGTKNNGATVSIQSGVNAQMLDIYTGLESTTFYPRHTQGKVTDCTASATTGDSYFKEVPRDSDLGTGVSLGAAVQFADTPSKLLQIDTDGNSNWFSVTNDGQSNANGGLTPSTSISNSANLTISTGGTGSVTILYRPAYNKGYGVLGNVLACQYPQAVYDSATPLVISLDGSNLVETATKPSSTNYPLIGANNTVKAFAMPGIDGRAKTIHTMTVLARADSNHNPSGVGDAINCTIFDASFYKRQADGKYVLDIENRDTNADVAATLHPSFAIGMA